MNTTHRHQEALNDFIKSAEQKVIIAGYGSLLSQYSRQTYSHIMGSTLPVMVNGWERSWITRSTLENQTYAGAIPNAANRLSAQLVALQFDERFAQREQDYRFTRISPNNIITQCTIASEYEPLQHLLEKTPIYICETLAVEPSSSQYPVSLSYVNTCLVGSYEGNGKDGVDTFFNSTEGWHTTHFFDDTNEHRYPRSSSLTSDDTARWGKSYATALQGLMFINDKC